MRCDGPDRIGLVRTGPVPPTQRLLQQTPALRYWRCVKAERPYVDVAERLPSVLGRGHLLRLGPEQEVDPCSDIRARVASNACRREWTSLEAGMPIEGWFCSRASAA